MERKNKLKEENRCFRCFSKHHIFVEIEALVTDTITAAPLSIPDTRIQNDLIVKGFVLADACSNFNQGLDILIGADLFWEIVDNSKVEKINKSLYCIPTIFGYTVQGIQEKNKENCATLTNLSSVMDVQVLWDLELLGIREENEIAIEDKQIRK
nr:uncharacterized protein LOC122273556 [Parasteatoda tepidariorum]